MIATWQISPRHPSTKETAKACGRKLPQGDSYRALRQIPQLLHHEPDRAADLQLPDEGSGEDVAGRPRRDRDVGEAIDSRGEVVADIAVDAAGSRSRPDQAQCLGHRTRDRARVLESRLDRERVPEEAGRPGHVRKCSLDSRDQLLDARRLDVQGHAPRPDQAAAEPAAAEQGGRVQEIAADASAIRGRGQEADVARQGPEVPRVVCQPLQLERHAAQRLRPQATAGPRPAPRSPGSTPSACPTEVSPATCSIRWIVRLSGPPASARSNPAMLIAEGDLQVEDVLAVALETEVPRLDDTGVHRPDGDLVDLMAVDAEEFGGDRRDGGLDQLGRRPRPGIMSRRDTTGGTGLA